MERAVRDQWVAALRSGEYREGKGYLEDECGRFCCLGVLAKVLGIEYEPAFTQYLPGRDVSGLTAAEQRRLASLNDTGISFKAIANHIELEIKVAA